MTARVMIVVTHLLGAGHLSRMLTLGRAFHAAGHSVDLLSGGFPAQHLDTSGIRFHQLPPLRSDGTNFARILMLDGTPVTPQHIARRQRMLSDLLRASQPDILITELFPFGRRNLTQEFHAVLHAAQDLSSRPRIFASIRDILAPPSKPSKQAFAEDLIARHYDAVLVHSDKTVIPLETSWPVSPAISHKLRYTGFVAPSLPLTAAADGAGEILVSAGGGNVGDPVFRAALQAAARSDRRWRLLVGGREADMRIGSLADGAPANVTVEGARADFRAMLRNAAASVSLCGYNTAMDVLQIGLPAVMVPFDDGGEVEQRLRATALTGQRGIEVTPMGTLNGTMLIEALERACAAPPRDPKEFLFDGAEQTVRICMEYLN